MNERKGMAQFLFIIGIIQILLGLILGIILSNVEVQGLYSSYNEFSWTIFLTVFFSSVISGIFFISLAEIIRLLNGIYNKIPSITAKPTTLEGEHNEEN